MLERTVLVVGVTTEEPDGLPACLEEPVDHFGTLVGPEGLGAYLPQGLTLGLLKDVHHGLSCLVGESHLGSGHLSCTEFTHLHGHTLLLAKGIVREVFGTIDLDARYVADIFGLLGFLVTQPLDFGGARLLREVDCWAIAVSLWPNFGS